MFFREETGRLGLVRDGNANYSCRSYFIVEDDLNNQLKDQSMTEILKILKAFVNSLIKGINITTKNSEDSFPIRLQIFYNKNDKFLSIVCGYKLSSNTKNSIEASLIRYHVALESKKENVWYIHTNCYETHKPHGSWDIAHCEDAPIVDLKKKDCEKLLKTIIGKEEKGE